MAIGLADALLVTAGAGMGVDSGLPDFRGTEGFWRAYPAIARLGLSFAQMANPSWFETEPSLAWAFYGHRLNLYRDAVPHAGFRQLLEIGATKRFGCFVFTSNVDGQFQKAGFAPDRIVECHGSIHHFQCTGPCTEAIWDAGPERMQVEAATFRALGPLPKCPRCGAMARPNILMFGDGAWIGDRTLRQREALDDWLGGLLEGSARLAVIELGAGTAIPTVRHASEQAAWKASGTLVRINPRESRVPAGHFGLTFGAAEGIKRLCATNLVLGPRRGDVPRPEVGRPGG